MPKLIENTIPHWGQGLFEVVFAFFKTIISQVVFLFLIKQQL